MTKPSTVASTISSTVIQFSRDNILAARATEYSVGCGGGANIDGDLAFAGSEHLSCELLPIAIEQRDMVSGPGSEHPAQMLGDVALQDHLVTGCQRLVSE